jgi:hypothetical protein
MKIHHCSGSGHRVFLSPGHHLEISYVYGAATLKLVVRWAPIVVQYAQGVLNHIQDNSRDSQLGDDDGSSASNVPVAIPFIIHDWE